MKLKLLEIPEEGLDLEASAGEDSWFRDLIQDAFQEDYHRGSPARLELHLFKTCDNISLTGSAEIEINPSCDRCLENFEKHFIVPLHVDLAPVKESDPREKDAVPETADEDLNFAFYQGEEIDVGEIVREMLLLEIPYRYLCSESCKGLCPRCGQNLNVKDCSCPKRSGDSRFSVLKKLLKS